MILEGGGPCRLTSGTQHHRYRCSLPGLAGLAASRRGEADTSHHKLVVMKGANYTSPQ